MHVAQGFFAVRLDGLFFTENTTDTYGGEDDIKEVLSEYFDVTVTSIHSDDCDVIGVWIAYK